MDEYCCDAMRRDLQQECCWHPDRWDCPDALIGRMEGGYGLIIHDGGSSVSAISFCPWCGTKLPPVGSSGTFQQLP